MNQSNKNYHNAINKPHQLFKDNDQRQYKYWLDFKYLQKGPDAESNLTHFMSNGFDR
ncbi:hypothetical protein [Cysteiniphilum sp. JM-1]|uniref:hypothetical protein n=1 Tax=Cysteiniphilum sp. JM-1 TaxID=2610891 RepID=UPI00168D916C|nr:hypothetical protein [Cysteiniphilum sp. JM-1]